CDERMTRISGQAVPSANDPVRRLHTPKRRLMMKHILALSGIALILSADSAQADPVRKQDPHEQARHLILSATQHSEATPTTTAPATLALTDPL
ncbi:hypothetical protein LLG90_27610, partial [Aromatoleum toluclasticum]|nr:hypothetical protein [Aromatoleum toluclasticum]